MSEQNSRLSSIRCVAIICSLWVSLLLLLLLLQLSGTGMGLKIWPMGEDRTWIGLLQNNHGADVAKAFWLLNDRNPLSPWWYVFASPLMVQFDYGIYLVRRLVDLFLALSVYALLVRLFARELRPLALIISLLVLVWNFSFYYTEQIMWNFLVALAMSNLSIWAFLRFLDGGRRNAGFLGVSLLFYFTAFASYSIQSGVPLAVFCFGYLRGSDGRSKWSRLIGATGYTSLYISLFLLFTLTWATTSRPSSDYYALEPGLMVRQLWPSLHSLVWQSDYAPLASAIVRTWNPVMLMAIGVSAATLTFFLVRKIVPAEFFTRLSSPASRKKFGNAGRDLVIVTAAISLPTILLESMSAVWFPGSRVRMISQEVSPFLIVIIVTAFIWWLAQKQKVSSTRDSLAIVVSIVFTAGLLMGLQYNKQLSQQTEMEKNLAKGMKHFIDWRIPHQYFLVRLDGVKWACSPFLHDTCIQTFFDNKNLSLRVLQTIPAPAAVQQSWRVKFGDAQTGIKYAAFNTGDQRIPWKQAVFVSFDGKTVKLINPVRREDLAGLQADFESSEPVSQSSLAPSLTTIKAR